MVEKPKTFCHLNFYASTADLLRMTILVKNKQKTCLASKVLGELILFRYIAKQPN